MTYRLTIAMRDNRILNDFAADELSTLAWMERPWFLIRARNIFNALGYQRPETVRAVVITGSESPTKARARWFKDNQS